VPVLGRYRHQQTGEQHGGKVHHGRRDEGRHPGVAIFVEDSGADRHRDEHQADQHGGRGADEDIKITPIVKQFRERGPHIDPPVPTVIVTYSPDRPDRHRARPKACQAPTGIGHIGGRRSISLRHGICCIAP